MSTIGHPVLLIDAMNLFIRNFVKNPTMSTQGVPMGGFVGFLTSLKLMCEKFNPERVIIIWEGGGSPRRRKIYANYKGNKKPQKLNRFYDDIENTVNNYDSQIATTIEALRHVPVTQLYIADCEADDIIGYLSKYKYNDKKCIIISSDKDLYQLVSDNISQWTPSKKLLITPDIISELYSVHHTNFCLLRCFVGDSSDCIDGIKHVGFKTMVKNFNILSEQSDVTIDDIFNISLERSKSSKVTVYKSIIDNIDIVKRNWKLMYLDTSNLSGDQIQRLISIDNNNKLSKNKMALIRLMIREGLQTFDIDSFFMTLKSIG